MKIAPGTTLGLACPQKKGEHRMAREPAKTFTYKSYNFIDKDPIIDEIRTIVQEHGGSYKDIHEHSGVAAATLTAWFSGPTRKPQAATINAVVRSMGWKLGLMRIDAEPLVQPTPAPKKPEPKMTAVRHIVQMAKYKRGRA
jgi:hypothetical protein